MPANLNALIRYKTINSCLYGGKHRWSIGALIDACSEALGDARGVYSVSERTIRDDIRVMRSDILGFNAPIVQERGLYYYSNPQYSILGLKITDPVLAEKIYAFLAGLRNEIVHPELESILEHLCRLTDKDYEKPVSPGGFHKEERPEPRYNRSGDDEEPAISELTANIEPGSGIMFSGRKMKSLNSFIPDDKKPSNGRSDALFSVKPALSWGDVFGKLT